MFKTSIQLGKQNNKTKQKLTRGGRKMTDQSQSTCDVFQCKSNTVKKRCRKRTAHTSKCWIHLAKENNLRIKKSNIPNSGKGLFSWKNPFKRFQTLGKKNYTKCP